VNIPRGLPDAEQPQVGPPVDRAPWPSAGPKIDLGWACGSARWRVSVSGFWAPCSAGCG